MKHAILLIVMLLIVGCGSASDTVSDSNAGESSDSLASSSEEYPNCSGTYIFVKQEGDLCSQVSSMNTFIVKQDDDVVTMTDVVHEDKKICSTVTVPKEKIPDIIVGVNEVVMFLTYDGKINCYYTIYPDKALSVICRDGGWPEEYSVCNIWFRKDSYQQYDTAKYPQLIYYGGYDAPMEACVDDIN